MFGRGPATKIYLGSEPVDMRKGFEGLFGLVRDQFGQDPLSGHLFLFTNRRHTRLKRWSGMAAAYGSVRNGWSADGSTGRNKWCMHGIDAPRRTGHAGEWSGSGRSAATTQLAS